VRSRATAAAALAALLLFAGPAARAEDEPPPAADVLAEALRRKLLLQSLGPLTRGVELEARLDGEPVWLVLGGHAGADGLVLWLRVVPAAGPRRTYGARFDAAGRLTAVTAEQRDPSSSRRSAFGGPPADGRLPELLTALAFAALEGLRLPPDGVAVPTVADERLLTEAVERPGPALTGLAPPGEPGRGVRLVRAGAAGAVLELAPAPPAGGPARLRVVADGARLAALADPPAGWPAAPPPAARRLEPLDAAGGVVAERLADRAARARLEGLRPVVLLTAPGCIPCAILKDHWRAPRIAAATAGLDLVVVDIETSGPGVPAAGLPTDVVPTLVPLDPDGRPTPRRLVGWDWSEDDLDAVAGAIDDFLAEGG